MLTSKTFFQPTPRDLLLQNQSCISLKILHKTSHFVGGKKLLLGGNLASYCTLLGTPWEPTPPPHWLFLEEIKEQPYKLDRLLTQLALSRSFKSCRGVVLGHFTECPQFKKIVKQWAVDHSTTVLFGFPAGHDRPNIPLILGDYVTLAPEKRGRVSFSRQIPILGA
jgi:muramoyltetrapeptide carboxypeptidase LdcA involved in peptidoglycan recycling